MRGLARINMPAVRYEGATPKPNLSVRAIETRRDGLGDTNLGQREGPAVKVVSLGVPGDTKCQSCARSAQLFCDYQTKSLLFIVDVSKLNCNN